MRRLPAYLPLSLACLLASSALAADDPVLTQAQKLLDQRQAQAAFDLLAPLEDTRAGNPDFDYLYGTAALDTNRGGIAAFAFERCLAVDPRHGPCRVMMARTHLALGEHKSARRELETVQASSPPPEVKALVSQYLGAAARQEAGEKRAFSAYAQLGLGHDSNVSSTTADTQIAIPLFGGVLFTLNGVSTRQDDVFAQAEAGASYAHALSPAWSLLADATVAARQYQDVDVFNNRAANLGLGVSWRQGPDNVQLKLQAQDYALDNEGYRSLYGTMAQYQRALDDSTAVSLYTQASRLDHHLLGVPDASRYTLGTGYSRALEMALSPVLYGGFYGGREVSEGPDLLNQDFYGLRLGGSLGLTAALRLTAGLSVEQRKFGDTDFIFLETREDTGYDASLGAIWQLTPALSLRPNYSFTRNDSNVVLSDYDRHVGSLDLRYEM
jgi:hypothetical protein